LVTPLKYRGGDHRRGSGLGTDLRVKKTRTGTSWTANSQAACIADVRKLGLMLLSTTGEGRNDSQDALRGSALLGHYRTMGGALRFIRLPGFMTRLPSSARTACREQPLVKAPAAPSRFALLRSARSFLRNKGSKLPAGRPSVSCSTHLYIVIHRRLSNCDSCLAMLKHPRQKLNLAYRFQPPTQTNRCPNHLPKYTGTIRLHPWSA
jgi:hypothetical protein